MTAHLLSKLLLGGLIFAIPSVALLQRKNILKLFAEGSMEGAKITLKVFPYMLAMIITIGMLRTAGAFELLSNWAKPLLHYLGIPGDIVPLAIARPLSGSAANGVFANIVDTHGGDALISKMSALIMGSTETTFYVVAIYFGAVGVQKTRHAIPAGLIADTAGIAAAVFFANLFFS